MNSRMFICIIGVIILCSCSGKEPTTPLVYTGEVPFPLMPEDGAVISGYSTVLVVKNATGFDGPQSRYLFQIASDKAFSKIIMEREVEGGIGTTSFNLNAALQASTYYYWRAKAFDQTNSTGFSVAFVFAVESISTPPQQISPVKNGIEINGSVVLKVKNSSYFSSEKDIYHFELYYSRQISVPIISQEVKSQKEYTQIKITNNLQEGMYLWRVRAYHAAGGDVESTQFSELVSFYVAEDCNKIKGSKYAVRLVESNLTCGIYNSYQDATEALGQPNAFPIGVDSYRGFVSLGIDGWIVVEMGRCIRNLSGSDLMVYQTVSYEGVGVAVAETPDGPWHWLGIRRCDEHTPYYSFACYFDLTHDEVTPWARYVKVYDFMRTTMPEWAVCELDPPHPGADIDAVEVIHSY